MSAEVISWLDWTTGYRWLIHPNGRMEWAGLVLRKYTQLVWFLTGHVVPPPGDHPEVVASPIKRVVDRSHWEVCGSHGIRFDPDRGCPHHAHRDTATASSVPEEETRP